MNAQNILLNFFCSVYNKNIFSQCNALEIVTSIIVSKQRGSLQHAEMTGMNSLVLPSALIY